MRGCRGINGDPRILCGVYYRRGAACGGTGAEYVKEIYMTEIEILKAFEMLKTEHPIGLGAVLGVAIGFIFAIVVYLIIDEFFERQDKKESAIVQEAYSLFGKEVVYETDLIKVVGTVVGLHIDIVQGVKRTVIHIDSDELKNLVAIDFAKERKYLTLRGRADNEQRAE